MFETGKEHDKICGEGGGGAVSLLACVESDPNPLFVKSPCHVEFVEKLMPAFINLPRPPTVGSSPSRAPTTSSSSCRLHRHRKRDSSSDAPRRDRC